MYDFLLSKIRTSEDKDKLLDEIDLLLNGLYQYKGFGFDSLLENKVRAWVSTFLREEFAKEALDRNAYLLDLKKKLMNLKEVSLIIAYEPTSDALESFFTFIRSAIGQNAIINLGYDPHLIGGVQIIFEGQFRDFSFKRIFEKVFEENRGEILKVLETKTSTQDETGFKQENI